MSLYEILLVILSPYLYNLRFTYNFIMFKIGPVIICQENY